MQESSLTMTSSLLVFQFLILSVIFHHLYNSKRYFPIPLPMPQVGWDCPQLSRLVLGPTQPLVLLIPGLFHAVKHLVWDYHPRHTGQVLSISAGFLLHPKTEDVSCCGKHCWCGFCAMILEMNDKLSHTNMHRQM